MVIKWVIGILLVLILWSFIEKEFLSISRFKLSSNKLARNTEPIRIVMLADLHNNTFGKKNKRLIRQIDKLEPDMIIGAGDIITKHKPCYPSHGYDLMKELAVKYPTYYGYGNHELYFDIMKEELNKDRESEDAFLLSTWEEYLDRLQGLGVQILKNESSTLKIKNTRLRISGLNLAKDYYPKGKADPSMELNLHSQIGASAGEYQILIAHNPIYFDAYAEWGADLTLAGHLHGGLARLPFLGGVVSPQYKFFPRYDSGIYEKGKRKMVVSKGLGSHSIMLRLFNPPDIVFITLISEEEK